MFGVWRRIVQKYHHNDSLNLQSFCDNFGVCDLYFNTCPHCQHNHRKFNDERTDHWTFQNPQHCAVVWKSPIELNDYFLFFYMDNFFKILFHFKLLKSWLKDNFRFVKLLTVHPKNFMEEVKWMEMQLLLCLIWKRVLCGFLMTNLNYWCTDMWKTL